MKTEKIKAYKAFDMNFKCRDFQYEVGKTYHHKGDVSVCASGFHSCTNPLDILNYYDLTNCRFAEVEAWGDIEKHNDDSKLVSRHIKVVRELSLAEFIGGASLCLSTLNDDNIQATSGDSSQLAASGYSSHLAASGNSSQLAASGNSSQLAASGYSSHLAASGNSSQLAASGNSSHLAALGDSSHLAASGDSSHLAASGYSSHLAASGDYSKLEVSGENSVAANIGVHGLIKGIKGTWITLAEYASGKCICVKSAQIDGKKLKANTWYKLQNGEFAKVQP
jgi:hypothetical protein